MMKKHNHSLIYRPDIDALRALAVIAVVGFHSFGDIFSSGYLGVDIFFVISGFLITKILIKRSESNQGLTHFFSFWSARIKRLFPALLFVLSVTLVIGYLCLFTTELENLGFHTWRSLIYWQNFTLISEIGYFDPESIKKPLLHLWSLSVEEHFYIIWPFLIQAGLLFGKYRRSALLVIMILFSISSLLYSHTLAEGNTQAAFYHSFTRFWEMTLGGMVSLLVSRKHNKAWVGVSIIFLLACLMITEATINKLAHQVLICGLTALTIWLGFSIKQKSLIVHLGKISYPLYLWHWVIFSFANIIFQIQIGSFVPTSLLILLSLVLATLTYLTIEKLRYAEKGLLTCFVWGLVLFFTAFYVHKTMGLPNRPHLAYQQDYDLQQIRHDASDVACTNLVGDPKFHYCRFDDAGFDKTVVIVGDSHGHVLFPGMVKIARSHSYNTLLLANSSCPPLPGYKWYNKKVSIEACQSSISQIYDTLNGYPQVHKVIIATRGPVYIHGEPERPFTQASIEASLEVFKDPKLYTYDNYGAGLTLAVQALSKLPQVDIFYMLENPELDFVPADTIPRPFVKNHDKIVSRSLYDLRMKKYNETIRRATGDKVTILDPRDAMCDFVKCRFFDKRLLYSDDDHFSEHGGYYTLKYFETEIFETP
jgi:peptidoglycan/LPS O-acetylase OafA/YrhL